MLQPESWKDVGLFNVQNHQRITLDQGQLPCQVIFSSHPNVIMKSRKCKERKNFGINIAENPQCH